MTGKVKFLKKSILISLSFMIVSSFLFYSNAAVTALFSDNFDNGKLNDAWYREFSKMQYSGTIVNMAAASGAFRAELNKNDPDVQGSKRAEITLDREKANEEHWYSVDILLPDTKDEFYVDDVSPEIILQFHNYPDPDEEWTSPPLSLETENGRYYIRRCWDDAPITSNDQIYRKGYYSSDDLGSYSEDRGKWVNWVFHVKWGWEKSQNPILEVYKNGKKAIDFNGMANTTNDKSGVYLKIGIYKWEWKMANKKYDTTRRIVYYDNVSIDDVEKMKLGK